ncbi:GPI mannosyltransferase 2-like [Acanthaster planci]|uniref:GPI mannosyltransferase 2 n=1 Tax=Acanthaster planci TaxID=133434 RepID=A0A8B7YLE8_ACAPL|nr:GPI mannosyltransferase 2-like [Acanthaster planci]XP_022094089.1 GPI mannosyltransferase 2-like [Acanthaster planci]
MFRLSLNHSYPISVAFFALLSRLTAILIQVAFANVLPDHQADAFHLEPIANPSASDRFLHFLLGGYSKWDASYFLHIVQHGYTETQMFAFFPLFPSVVRVFAEIIVLPLQQLLSLRMHLFSSVLLSAVTLNIFLFSCAAVLLYHLGVRVLSCQRLAYKAALLFCINPASVFMTSAYTESLFASLSFAGMLALEHDKLLCSALCFAFSGAARSNGIISVAFLLYFSVKKGAALFNDVVQFEREESRLKATVLWKMTCCHLRDVLGIASVLPLCCIIFLPFVLFQIYSFMTICTSENDIVSFVTSYFYGMTIPVLDHAPSFCDESMAIPYTAIQSQHWNVGFLKYYELKQLPNFLLALPMVVLCVDAVATYCRKRWQYVRVLGLLETPQVQLEYRRSVQGRPWLGVFSNKSFVYIVHLAALLLFGISSMHVQVVTRFIASSCPVVFWYAAYVTSDKSEEVCRPREEQAQHQDTGGRQNINGFAGNDSLLDVSKNALILQFMRWKEQRVGTRLVLGYFAGYFVVGIAMHCNFLPWT